MGSDEQNPFSTTRRSFLKIAAAAAALGGNRHPAKPPNTDSPSPSLPTELEYVGESAIELSPEMGPIMSWKEAAPKIFLEPYGGKKVPLPCTQDEQSWRDYLTEQIEPFRADYAYFAELLENPEGFSGGKQLKDEVLTIFPEGYTWRAFLRMKLEDSMQHMPTAFQEPMRKFSQELLDLHAPLSASEQIAQESPQSAISGNPLLSSNHIHLALQSSIHDSAHEPMGEDVSLSAPEQTALESPETESTATDIVPYRSSSTLDLPKDL